MMFATHKILLKTALRVLRAHRDLKLSDRHQVDALGKKYGEPVIVADFTKWCAEIKRRGLRPPTYPVHEYLRVAETRMGKK